MEIELSQTMEELRRQFEVTRLKQMQEQVNIEIDPLSGKY